MRIFGRMGYALMKRCFDFCLATLLLVILTPVIGMVALLVWWKIGSPILFRQKRPGRGGQPFILYKFRTMTDIIDNKGNSSPDAVRLTPLGRVLRTYSLDELPELLNVLKGEMSLVGPRPLLMEYLPLYTKEQKRRHEVLPGITGWAQINGRNAINWKEKFKLDVWYVDHRSLWLDGKILFLTINKVFRAEGITQKGSATAEKFRGREKPGNSV